MSIEERLSSLSSSKEMNSTSQTADTRKSELSKSRNILWCNRLDDNSAKTKINKFLLQLITKQNLFLKKAYSK